MPDVPRNRILKDISGQGFSTWLVHQVDNKYKVSLTAAFSSYIVLRDVTIDMITNYLDRKHDKVLHSKHFPHHSLNLDENG